MPMEAYEAIPACEAYEAIPACEAYEAIPACARSPERGPLEVDLIRNDLTGTKQRSVYRRKGTREDRGSWAVVKGGKWITKPTVQWPC